jgi:radical SAM superfamily enzyme YgiQ (UPF0313 family)
MRIRLIDTPLAIPRYRQVRLPTVAAELSPYADVEINDENIEPVDYSPVDLVGITAQAYNAPRAIHLARRFKELGMKTILGGPLATGTGAQMLAHFDAVVLGEVEGLGERIVRDLERGELGGAYRLERPPEAWGTRPPRRDLQRADRYYWFNYPIELSRGCPHRCSFCFGSFAYPTFRKRSLQSIAEDLAQWDHGMIEVVDLHFAADRRHLIEVCGLLEQMKVAGWFGEATLHSLDDEEVLRHLERSNCKMVFVGIESVEQQALKAANKDFNRVERYRDAIRRIQDHGIYVHGGFIFGLDGQGPGSFDATVRFCEETKIYLASTNIATYYPGTAAFDQLEGEGRLVAADPRQFDGAHVVVRPAEQSAEEVYAGTRRFLGRFYSLWSIFRRSFQTPNFRLSMLVDFWAFNLLYRAYYKMWGRRLGGRAIPWSAAAGEEERESFPHMGGRMPLTYALFDRSWRFFHRWYAIWDRPAAPASLLLTCLLALLWAGAGLLGAVQVQREAAGHWPVPWPPVPPVAGAFGAATLIGTWLVTRLARATVGPGDRGWRRACSILLLPVAMAPMALCSLMLPLSSRGWSFVMSFLTVLFLMKSLGVLGARASEAVKNPPRVSAFILLFPTLDFERAFVPAAGPKRPLLAHLPLYLRGLALLVAGILFFPLLFSFLIRNHEAWIWVSAGHLGRLVLVYLVLCGALQWLTGYWRMAGYQVPDPFGRWWWASVSPARLWRGWNSVMHRWLVRQIYLPVGGRRLPVLAVLLVFLVSGLLSALALYPVVGRLSGEMVLFFLANGAVVALEKLVLRGGQPPLAAQLAFYLLGVLVFFVTAPWLFDATDLIFL